MQLATVSSIAPLEVKRYGDESAVPAQTSDVVAIIGDQVLTETIDNTVYVIARLGGASVPTGTLQPFAGTTAPPGFLLCQFQAVSRTDYPNLNALAAAAGYTGLWGPGNGSTTFNVPDGRGRSFIGAGTFAAFGATDGLAEASRTPRHTHTVPTHAGHVHVTGAHDHPISTGGNHQHGAGSLSANSANRGTGAVGTAVNPITGSVASSGDHNHGGNTGNGGGGTNTGNSGDHDHTGAVGLSAANASPYFAGNWIIKD